MTIRRHRTARPRRTTRTHRKPRLENPAGGLTAAGRKSFAKKEGAHLKPGVTKSMRDMTPTEMRRKGSWAVRFYGRSGALPPLIDKHGNPTRFAKTAAAWGEPVPSPPPARSLRRAAACSPATTRTKPDRRQNP